MIQIRLAGHGRATPAQLGAGTQSLTVFIDDVDTHFEHAKAEGAKIVEDPTRPKFGEWQYAAEDVDAHQWLFSRHVRDVDPGECGTVSCQTSKCDWTRGRRTRGRLRDQCGGLRAFRYSAFLFS